MNEMSDANKNTSISQFLYRKMHSIGRTDYLLQCSGIANAYIFDTYRPQLRVY